MENQNKFYVYVTSHCGTGRPDRQVIREASDWDAAVSASDEWNGFTAVGEYPTRAEAEAALKEFWAANTYPDTDGYVQWKPAEHHAARPAAAPEAVLPNMIDAIAQWVKSTREIRDVGGVELLAYRVRGKTTIALTAYGTNGLYIPEISLHLTESDNDPNWLQVLWMGDASEHRPEFMPGDICRIRKGVHNAPWNIAVDLARSARIQKVTLDL